MMITAQIHPHPRPSTTRPPQPPSSTPATPVIHQSCWKEEEGNRRLTYAAASHYSTVGKMVNEKCSKNTLIIQIAQRQGQERHPSL
ncbi:unnamed protein product [Haemonchus placei]|uniref:Uncharacterized protein n=1 Tax=Haemonchus placei TaxID=6290 RepID=A0A0N4WWW2_HAEPC|nr:unnamed protein product [Haemonchus placei]